MMDNVDGRLADATGLSSAAPIEPASPSRPKASIPSADADGYATVSNGMKVYVGLGDPTNSFALVERMIAAGHVPVADEDGCVDFFVTSGGFCNGPGCSVCHDTVCRHCTPDWQPDPCPGAEGYAAEQRERRRQKFLELKAEFEPAQGMEARSGETGTGSTEGDSPVPQGCAQGNPQ